jgi:methionyl-tRNA formyltransferase
MTDPIIFKTNGKEGFHIPFSPSSFPYVGSKCPETKLEVKEMTEFQPTPQTPEQVDTGLRNAFRQAIKDGVMDATPYLKQMTFNTDIEKTEKEIAVLQKKLELLKEIETHKSQPKMTFDYGGKFEIVSYNYEEYLRLEFNDGSHNWSKRKHTVDGVVMVAITDGETHRLLEGVWFNDVKKGKYD